MLRFRGKAPTVVLALRGHLGQVRQTKVSELSIYTKNKMFLQNRSSMHLGKKCCETYANSVFCCFEVWELSSQIIRLVQTKRRAPQKVVEKLSENPSQLNETHQNGGSPYTGTQGEMFSIVYPSSPSPLNDNFAKPGFFFRFLFPSLISLLIVIV